MADEPVLIRDQRDAVLVLRLNRPEARNAFNPALMGELGAALAEAETDPDVGAVVITGTGDRSFCAGMDLRSFSSGGGSTPTGSAEGQATFSRFLGGETLDVPIVGAAQATAVAGGFELLLNCDLAVVAEDAKLGLPEVKRALFAAGGGVFLSNRIPLALALELTLTGEYISAQRAYEIGLVNRVVPADEVVDAAVELAEHASPATARSPSAPPRRSCGWPTPTWSRRASASPSGCRRCSAARTPRRAPWRSSRSATPSGRASRDRSAVSCGWR